jgi:hypothetical protein
MTSSHRSVSAFQHDALMPRLLPASVVHTFAAALAFALRTFVHEEAALGRTGSLGAWAMCTRDQKNQLFIYVK